jgi:hypothetical protein
MVGLGGGPHPVGRERSNDSRRGILSCKINETCKLKFVSSEIAVKRTKSFISVAVNCVNSW